MASQLTISGSKPKSSKKAWKTVNSSLFNLDPTARIERAKQADVAAIVYVNNAHMIQYLWAPVFDYGDPQAKKPKLQNVYGNAVNSCTNIFVVGIEHHLMKYNMGLLRATHLDDSLDQGDPLTIELLDKTKFATNL